MDIFKKVFNGDERLVMTFWAWGVLGMIVWVAVTGVIFYYSGLLNSFTVFVAEVVYLAFAGLGIWRSADKYKGASHWQLLAKVWVGIIAAYIIYGFVFPAEPPAM